MHYIFAKWIIWGKNVFFALELISSCYFRVQRQKRVKFDRVIIVKWHENRLKGQKIVMFMGRTKYYHLSLFVSISRIYRWKNMDFWRCILKFYCTWICYWTTFIALWKKLHTKFCIQMWRNIYSSVLNFGVLFYLYLHHHLIMFTDRLRYSMNHTFISSIMIFTKLMMMISYFISVKIIHPFIIFVFIQVLPFLHDWFDTYTCYLFISLRSLTHSFIFQFIVYHPIIMRLIETFAQSLDSFIYLSNSIFTVC